MAPIDFEPIVGRYLQVPIDGRMCRVYVEQAGTGIPGAVPAHGRCRCAPVPTPDVRQRDH